MLLKQTLTLKLARTRTFSTLIREPTDPANLNHLKVSVGDYAEAFRTYTDHDLELFSEAIQDKHAAHKTTQSTFYRADIVYGIFSAALFTSIFRSTFPRAIYLS